jgi:hypothetical protein
MYLLQDIRKMIRLDVLVIYSMLMCYWLYVSPVEQQILMDSSKTMAVILVGICLVLLVVYLYTLTRKSEHINIEVK